ncbi:hypothetical protein RSOLAG1IB_09584 [Rhizoctonia solani AG-1 IB]|uniref:Uncharacterized protein n=1 Tax=Thanatephorus cucumeris (strain AG1-IB / isolate 7/3/14) TaxID=1108050 RepID=A0A0B7FQT7_THACB|nr:hypothetical protein RSOLAG1IB_09584 [Rhizoctonia solani AG-1 IB]
MTSATLGPVRASHRFGVNSNSSLMAMLHEAMLEDSVPWDTQASCSSEARLSGTEKGGGVRELGDTVKSEMMDRTRCRTTKLRERRIYRGWPIRALRERTR